MSTLLSKSTLIPDENRISGAAVPGRYIGWRAGTPAPLHGGPPHRPRPINSMTSIVSDLTNLK